MLTKKSVYHYPILIILLLFPLLGSAQKTLEDASPVYLYNKGLTLYENGQYGAAQMVFRQFLSAEHKNQNQRIEAEYYIALSAMELYQNDAEALLTAFMEKHPEDPKARTAMFSLAQFQFRNKDFNAALATLEKIDESGLDEDMRGEYRFMLGYAYFRKHEYAKAKELLADIKDIPGEHQAIASYYYGYIAYEEGNYKDAVAEFVKIKDDKKFKKQIPVYITQIYLLQGKYDKVIEYGQEALHDQETDRLGEVVLYMAEAYFLKKDYKSAIAYYDTARSHGASMTPHHNYQLGFAQYKTERYEDAISTFNQLEVNKDSLGQNIAYHLGSAYLKTGDKIKARTSLEFASGLKFNRAVQEQALLNYAKVSYDLGFQKEGVESLRTFLKEFPKSDKAADAKELLGQILLSGDNPREALEIIESIPNRSAKLNEAYQKILYQYGIQLFSHQDYDNAIGYLGKSIQQAVDRKIKAEAYFFIAEGLYRQQKYQDALDNYKNFLYIDDSRNTPYHNTAPYNIGYCYFKMEDYVRANTYFLQYLEWDRGKTRTSRYNDAVLRSADCNLMVRNYDKAVDRYDEIISSHAPEGDYAMFQKGIIMGLEGNTNEKINTLRKLSTEYPKSAYLDDALFAIGDSYTLLENFPQAIREFSNLNRDYPKNKYFIRALLKIGQSYLNMDQDTKAVGVFKNIIEKYPNSTEAREANRAIQNSYIDRGLTDSLSAFISANPSGNTASNKQDSLLYAAAFKNIRNNDCNAALNAFNSYLKSYPNGSYAVDAHYYMADCNYRQNSFDQAQQHYNVVINRSPNSYIEQSLVRSAELYYKDNNYDMAAKRYQQLEDVANNQQNVLLALTGQMRSNALLNNYQGTLENASKIMNLSFADENTKTEAEFYTAKSQLGLNQTDQALATFTSVYGKTRSEIGAEAMYNVAYIQYLQEKYPESKKTIYDLQDRYPTFDYWRAKAYILLSDVFVKMGDTFQAKGILEGIIKNYPGEDLRNEAKTKLKDIQQNEKGK